jgi:ferredoxin--NADP+ reductase
VSYAGWRCIDVHETAMGNAQGRPRVKLTNVADMLAVAKE